MPYLVHRPEGVEGATSSCRQRGLELGPARVVGVVGVVVVGWLVGVGWSKDIDAAVLECHQRVDRMHVGAVC